MWVNFVNLQKPREDSELFIVVSIKAFSITRNFLAFLTKDICVCVCVVCVGVCVYVCGGVYVFVCVYVCV